MIRKALISLESIGVRVVKFLFFEIFEFSNEKQGFKTMVFQREHLPVKNTGFKTIVFYRDFEGAP